MELLQVDMGIYYSKMHFKVVRYQMSHCYLYFNYKNNIKKWYLEYFIVDYFPTLNKKDPVDRRIFPDAMLDVGFVIETNILLSDLCWLDARKLLKSSTTFYKIKLELISLGGLISAGDAVVVHPSNKLSSVNILLCRPNDVHSQIIKAQPRDIFAIHFKCLLSIYNLNVCTIILH